MTAAIFAAQSGADVLLLEKNERLGRKLGITGKGRCNVTNNCDIVTLEENIPNNARFLYGAFSRWSPRDTMAFFEELGVPLKTERGQRVFPVSDKASDIVNALVKRLEKLNVTIKRENARSLITEDGECRGVNTRGGQLRANAVILATGGASYPKTLGRLRLHAREAGGAHDSRTASVALPARYRGKVGEPSGGAHAKECCGKANAR